jgi:hypothetical protein
MVATLPTLSGFYVGSQGRREPIGDTERPPRRSTMVLPAVGFPDRWLPDADEQRWLAAAGNFATLAALRSARGRHRRRGLTPAPAGVSAMEA